MLPFGGTSCRILVALECIYRFCNEIRQRRAAACGTLHVSPVPLAPGTRVSDRETGCYRQGVDPNMNSCTQSLARNSEAPVSLRLSRGRPTADRPCWPCQRPIAAIIQQDNRASSTAA